MARYRQRHIRADAAGEGKRLSLEAVSKMPEGKNETS